MQRFVIWQIVRAADFAQIMCPEVAIEITTGNQTTGGDLKSG